MSNIFNLVRAFGRISSHSLISISPDRCLNMRYNRMFCNKCEHVCGADALSLDHIPIIDNTECIGCGTCVNVCPTGAFVLKDTSKEYILSAIKGSEKVVFSCRDREESGDACDAGTASGVYHIHIPCIGYLCEGVLIKAASISEMVIIDRVGCDQCTLKIDLNSITRKVDISNTILESFDKNPNIGLSEVGAGNAPLKNAFNRKSIDYLRNVYGGKTGDKDKNKNECVEENLGKDDTDGYIKSFGESSIIPITHTLLIDSIYEIGKPVNDVVTLEYGPLYNLSIVNSCDMCGICAAVCPTDALRFIEDGVMQTIGFNMPSCIGCGVCIQVCKNDAISYDAEIHLNDIRSSDWTSLRSHERIQCKRCKKYINSMKKDSLCSSCSLEQDVEQQFL